MALSSATDSDGSIHSTFASRYVQEPLPPRFQLPSSSITKDAAYRMISDELMLDGDPRLNLASFVTSRIERECDKLIIQAINKSDVEMKEDPVITEFQNRCVNIIANLFNAPLGFGGEAVGVGTVGSLEAITVAGFGFLRQWQNKRKAEGKPYDKPNIVIGANAQDCAQEGKCWEKFAHYFDVELKEVKLKKDYYIMDPVKAVEMVDENTICVAAILGSTYNGEFEDVKLVNDLLIQKNKETGWETPIHVDAARGGFIAPFLYPELEWDFRLPLVKSINVSGHKYGPFYAAIGWVIWRAKQDLPEELILRTNYLGADQPTCTRNFIEGASQIIAQYNQLTRIQIVAQYYHFTHLGFEGYRNIRGSCAANAKALSEGLVRTGRFNILSKEIGVPLVAFSLKDSSRHDEYEISDRLRKFGWIVPAYTMAPDAQEVKFLRVVVREDFNRSLAERLVHDIEKVLHELDTLPSKIAREVAASLVDAHPELKEVKDLGIDVTKFKSSAVFNEIVNSHKAVKAWKKFVAQKANRVC